MVVMGSRVVRVVMVVDREGMQVLHNTKGHQEVTEVSRVVSTEDIKEVTKVRREGMEDIREVTKVHQVATHHRVETREDILDTKAAIRDTRACLHPKN